MSIPNTCLGLNLDALVAVKQKMLKACIRASRQTLRAPDHLLCLKCYMWVKSKNFVVSSYSLCYPKQYCFSKKRKQRASNSARYSIPNMYSANRSCIEGLTDFAKSCVATHISEDMDRLTDCVGQCTICRSIPSELYEATQSCHCYSPETQNGDIFRQLTKSNFSGKV